MSDPGTRRANPPQAIKKYPEGTLFVVHDPDWSKVWAANVTEREARRVKNMVANRRLSRTVTFSPMPEDEATLKKMYGAIEKMVENGAYGGEVQAPLAVAPEASAAAELGRKGGETAHGGDGATAAPRVAHMDGVEAEPEFDEPPHVPVVLEAGQTVIVPDGVEVDVVQMDAISDDDVGDLSELLGDGETVDDMILAAGGEDLPPLDGDSK